MSDFKDAFEAGVLQAKPNFIRTENGTEYAFFSTEISCKELSRDRPARIIDQVKVDCKDSFVAYLDKYGNADTLIKIHESKIEGIIDYHAADGTPGWGGHVVAYTPPVSEQWEKRIAHDKKAQSQDELAEFVEDMASDFVRPDSATMLEIALTLEVASGVNFRRGVRLHDGRVQLQYMQQTEGRAGEEGRLEIPRQFSIGVPVFCRREAYAVEARLKYRLKDGSLKIWYELVRPTDVFAAAFADIQRETVDALAGRWLIVTDRG
jgi:uncharacterized protein YfdQ (DUF2303 family)